MSKSTRLLFALLLAVTVASCKKENGSGSEYESADAQAKAYNFVVYPAARYMGPMTDLVKKAHMVIVPSDKDAPPTAIYDTDAALDDVANYYAKEYGYGKVAPDATNNLSSAKPPAYFRTGDLHEEAVAIKPVAEKLGLNLDVNKAQGKYRGANIDALPTRPHVTLTRPYFDPIEQKVVDRTLIMLVRE
jgi:hypothetical protein